MKRNLLVVFSLILAGFLFFGCEKKEEVEEAAAPLVVAMELQFPPFEMSNEQGEPTGISVEMAKALGEYLGRPVVIENTAWTGLIPSLQTGKADLIISSMTITEERQKVIDFSDPYIKSGLTLLIAKDSPVQGFDDLNAPGRVVAVKSGTTGALIAQEKLKQAEVRFFDEVAACVLEVAQGKADAFIYDALTVYENHKKNREATRVNLEDIPGTAGYWGVGVKKGNEALLKSVNEFIAAFRDEGGFDRIAEKYLKDLKEVFDQEGVPFFFDL
ncbi:MAG: transporter substrate-binding domain-containing protein [Spirochaetales bacterium]|nr:transporter substrate-binding domain-containing protein [Spirochaetales bacterium]